MKNTSTMVREETDKHIDEELINETRKSFEKTLLISSNTINRIKRIDRKINVSSNQIVKTIEEIRIDTKNSEKYKICKKAIRLLDKHLKKYLHIFSIQKVEETFHLIDHYVKLANLTKTFDLWDRFDESEDPNQKLLFLSQSNRLLNETIDKYWLDINPRVRIAIELDIQASINSFSKITFQDQSNEYYRIQFIDLLNQLIQKINQKNEEREVDNDKIFAITGISWDQYEKYLENLGDQSKYRISYLEGTLSLMSPGRLHEITKETIGGLLESYLQESNIRYISLGSLTMRKQGEKSGGKEPDKSYYIGKDKDAANPNLSIEIIVSSGSIKNLEIYKVINMQEVWFWQANDKKLSIYYLNNGKYQKNERSTLLPNLDIQLLVKHILQPDQFISIREFRNKIRQAIVD